MSKLKDVYENLIEYVDVLRDRINEFDNGTDYTEYMSEEKANGIKQTFETVEEELTKILEGKGW